LGQFKTPRATNAVAVDFVARRHQSSQRCYSRSTLTVFERDVDAPAASVTVTVTVNDLGKSTTYVCPLL
jgi:hypothetical protein